MGYSLASKIIRGCQLANMHALMKSLKSQSIICIINKSNLLTSIPSYKKAKIQSKTGTRWGPCLQTAQCLGSFIAGFWGLTNPMVVKKTTQCLMADSWRTPPPPPLCFFFQFDHPILLWSFLFEVKRTVYDFNHPSNTWFISLNFCLDK